MIFVAIGTFWIKVFKFQRYVCNGCHDVSMMPSALMTFLLQIFAVLIITVLLTESAQERP